MVNGTKFCATGVVTGTVEVAEINVTVDLHQTKTLPTPVLLGKDFVK